MKDAYDRKIERNMRILCERGLLRRKRSGRQWLWSVTRRGEVAVLGILQRDFGSHWFHEFHTTETLDFPKSHEMLREALSTWLNAHEPATQEHLLTYAVKDALVPQPPGKKAGAA